MVIRILTVALALSTLGLGKTQERRIQGLLETAAKAQKGDDPVRSHLYLREAIGWPQLAGAALVIAGIVVGGRSAQRTPPPG